MANLRTLRDQLKARLETISGLKAYDVWPDSFFPPGAIVKPVSAEYIGDLTHGSPLWRFEIHVAVTTAGGIGLAQEALDEYLSSTGTASIKQAIEGGTTLGGNADACFVRGFSDYDAVAINSIESFFGAKVQVDVWTR